MEVDITKDNEVKLAIEKGIEKFGTIDVVVNNAGYSLVGSMEEMTDAEFRRTMDVNFFAAVNVMRSVIPHLRAKKAGHFYIIFLIVLDANDLNIFHSLYFLFRGYVHHSRIKYIESYKQIPNILSDEGTAKFMAKDITVQYASGKSQQPKTSSFLNQKSKIYYIFSIICDVTEVAN